MSSNVYKKRRTIVEKAVAKARPRAPPESLAPEFGAQRGPLALSNVRENAVGIHQPPLAMVQMQETMAQFVPNDL